MTNSPVPQLDSTLSKPTEASLHSDEVLALARRLIDQLNLEPTDTLGRWMAQYIAELTEAIATAPLADRPAAQERCFKAILELWSYRAELPDGKRPLADLEPIVRAIESLDPEKERPRYYGEAATKGKSARVLEFAKNLDTSARSLIRVLLGQAAVVGVDKSAEWLVAAEAAGLDSGVHEIAMHFLIDLQSEASPGLDERQRNVLLERVKRLEAFANVAALVSKDLRSQLGVFLPDSKGNDNDNGENSDAVKKDEDAESEDAQDEEDDASDHEDAKDDETG